MTAVQGGNFWNGFAAGAISSLAASAWGGNSTEEGFFKENNFAHGTRIVHHGIGFGGNAGMIAFGTIAGGAGAALTGGNFWQGAVTGLVVAGLNHAMHDGDNDDNVNINSKDKTATVERTGDDYDRIFVDGKEIMATPRGALGPALRENGFTISMKGPQGVGMGLTDLVLDAFNLVTGAIELKMGVTMLSKASLGLKVGLGGSKATLKSSVFYTKVLGINAKMPFRLPTIVLAPTNNFGLFLGRNASVFGSARMTAGGYGIFGNH
jgi:hypothetical protein